MESRQSTYFETAQSQYIVKELTLAIKDGKLIALSGIVGTGKTTTLRKIQEALEEDKEILIAKALWSTVGRFRSARSSSRSFAT